MSSSSHDDLIAEFTSVTGVASDRAAFYLEAAAWKVDVRMM